MREIKFRAWDTGSKIMSYMEKNGVFRRVYFAEDIQDWQDRALGGVLQRHNQGKTILMQYTGLKDRQGKEIYEGDIIKALHDFGPGGWVEKKTEVRFNLMNGYQWNYWDLDSLKVIGNIYENPELLKGEIK